MVDTNVLLDLYRYSDSARQALLDTLYGFSDRLWIPNQVALEYFNNRASVVVSQVRAYAGVIANLKSIRGTLSVPNKHPFVDGQIYDDFVRAYDQLMEALETKLNSHQRMLSDDEIKVALGGLFDQKVGSPFDSEELDLLIADGDIRFSESVPPGFADAKKFPSADSFELKLKKYGDLIIWKQLLIQAKLHGRSVILVTGEKKPDWWLKNGDDLIGPLPQLVKEFQSAVGRDFYLYTTDRFLEQAGQYLNRGTSQEVLDEVKAVGVAIDSSWQVSLEGFFSRNKTSSIEGGVTRSVARLKMQISAILDECAATREMISSLRAEIESLDLIGGDEEYLDEIKAKLVREYEILSILESGLEKRKSEYEYLAGVAYYG